MKRLSQHTVRLGLEAVSELLGRLGNPELGLRFIHLAGTNGKGSTGAMLEAALRYSGILTGFFSSPHLLDVRERFRVGGLALSEKEYAECCRIVSSAVRKEDEFTYFELTAALAAVAFRRAGCGAVVWETGLGGRLDATNVVTPLVSVITNIAMDHMALLGDTVEAIAGEKAGIVKPGVPVFAGVMPDAAARVIAARAEALHSLFVPVKPGKFENLRISFGDSGAVQRFNYRGRPVTLPLAGAMQRRNFALAAAVLDYLAPAFGFDASESWGGIASCRWPARCSLLRPGLLIDGGHNADCAEALVQTLSEILPGRRFTVIFGAFRDKDIRPELSGLMKIAGEFVFVPLHEPGRDCYSGEELRSALNGLAFSGEVHECDSAVAAAERFAGTGRMLLATGSLFLAGELLAALAPRDSVLNLV